MKVFGARFLNKIVKDLSLFAIFAAMIGNSSCLDSTTTSKNLTQFASEEVLLEVSTEMKGMVYPNGKVLNIKLYSSGRAEYDFYPPRNANSPTKLERKASFLEMKDLEEIKSLITNLSSAPAKSEYLPISPRLDAAITTTVIYRTKNEETKIVLTENDSDLLLEKKENFYPKPLLDLLYFVQRFHKKLLQ